MYKIGTYLMLVGMLLIGLFVLSDLANTPTCGYLIWGAVLLAVGLVLWFRNPLAPPKPSGRFRIFKKEKKP
jgi:hypothetical protein